MGFIGALLNFLLVICSIFMICLVLIQRGRGGGLAGAFGGLGGSSAFGTKAGDVFTRVTVVTAIIWFLLSMALVIVNQQGRSTAFALDGEGASAFQTTPTETPGDAAAKKATPAPKAGDAPAAPSAPGDSDLPPALTEDEPSGSAPAPAMAPAPEPEPEPEP